MSVVLGWLRSVLEKKDMMMMVLSMVLLVLSLRLLLVALATCQIRYLGAEGAVHCLAYAFPRRLLYFMSTVNTPTSHSDLEAVISFHHSHSSNGSSRAVHWFKSTGAFGVDHMTDHRITAYGILVMF